MAKKKDPTPGEYYGPCTHGYRRVDNPKAWETYFTATEPDEMPTHSTIISTTKVEAIMSVFIARLELDVIRNSRFSWVIGTPLPHQRDYTQPLAQGPNPAP